MWVEPGGLRAAVAARHPRPNALACRLRRACPTLFAIVCPTPLLPHRLLHSTLSHSRSWLHIYLPLVPAPPASPQQRFPSGSEGMGASGSALWPHARGTSPDNLLRALAVLNEVRGLWDHTGVCARAHAHMVAHMQTRAQAGIHSHADKHMHTHPRACAHASAYACTRVHTKTCIHMHTHAIAYHYTHAHTYTNVYAEGPSP